MSKVVKTKNEVQNLGMINSLDFVMGSFLSLIVFQKINSFAAILCGLVFYHLTHLARHTITKFLLL
jgi:predicted membrane protein